MLDSWTQNLLRYAVACLFWLPFLFFSIRKRQFDNATWRRAIVPALANVIMQSLYAAAFYYIGPAFMVLLAKTSIIWVAGFSLIFFAEERALARSKRFWLGLSLSVLGAVGVLCFKKDFAAVGTITGVVLTLAQAFMWAVYTVSVRIAFRDTDSRSGFSVISIYTVAGLFVFAMLFGRVGDFVKLGIGQWAAVVISGVAEHSVSPRVVLRGDEADWGDDSGACGAGAAVYCSCDFQNCLWRIVEWFPVAFWAGFVSGFSPCHLGPAAFGTWLVTRGGETFQLIIDYLDEITLSIPPEEGRTCGEHTSTLL